MSEQLQVTNNEELNLEALDQVTGGTVKESVVSFLCTAIGGAVGVVGGPIGVVAGAAAGAAVAYSILS